MTANSFPWGKVARRKLFSALTDGGALIPSPREGGTINRPRVIVPDGDTL